jgi:hypothetical protein
VLIVSSFTMAMAVFSTQGRQAAQLNHFSDFDPGVGSDISRHQGRRIQSEI